MTTRGWIILLVVLVALAFALGYFASTIKKVVDNRDKIGAGLDIATGVQTLFS